jgi:hypothetical protein
MITVSPPSLAINDSRAAVAYTMDATRTAYPLTSTAEIIQMILEEADRTPHAVLQNLVLTAHGRPGYFQLGLGLTQGVLGLFKGIRNHVKKIWLRGCMIARITGPETAHHGDGAYLRARGFNTGDGHAFVSALASWARCYVVAPTEVQSSVHATYPRGLMDSYEGLVVCYSPAGAICWRHRYRSLYGYDALTRSWYNPNRE